MSGSLLSRKYFSKGNLKVITEELEGVAAVIKEKEKIFKNKNIKHCFILSGGIMDLHDFPLKHVRNKYGPFFFDFFSFLIKNFVEEKFDEVTTKIAKSMGMK